MSRNFPDRIPDNPWPGAWGFGVDFAGDSERVVAVHFGGPDLKYGVDFIGPITLTDENMPRLVRWAEDLLDIHGGYVHLFPADGDAAAELTKRVNELEDLSA
jgi:hypothetical protein